MPRPLGSNRDKDFRNEKKSKPSADTPKRDSRESESKRGTRGTSRNAPIRKSEPKATDRPKRAPKPWEAKEEREYFANLKCTFCGELDSVCGGDHSEEMYWLSQPRYS